MNIHIYSSFSLWNFHNRLSCLRTTSSSGNLHNPARLSSVFTCDHHALRLEQFHHELLLDFGQMVLDQYHILRTALRERPERLAEHYLHVRRLQGAVQNIHSNCYIELKIV